MTRGQAGRRRFLRLMAAAAGLMAGGSTLGPEVRGRPVAAEIWRGTALGGEASLTLWHENRRQARHLLKAAVWELRRLEGMFSLYRPDSSLSRLNRRGEIRTPPLEFLELVSISRALAETTGGAFDPTVQPLWELHARHFAAPGADPTGPSEAALERARARIGWRRLVIEEDRVAFARPGMKVTLNGIAQGYITDRVADLLRRQGMEPVLLDLGEIRALGRHPAGRPFRIGLRDPRDPRRILREVPLQDRAIATSAGSVTCFDPSGRMHHLFDPRSGRSARLYASVSVRAPRATLADALSTALYVLSPAERRALRGRFEDVEAWILHRDGRLEHRVV